MTSLELLIVIGGILHFGTLIGSFRVPRELRFREELPKLRLLMRQWILVAGGYIVLCIVGFGLLSVSMPGHLASGQPLARALCGFIALFWFVRLPIQFFVFDARPYLRNWFLRIGYHGLTFVFVYHVLVYGAAAVL